MMEVGPLARTLVAYALKRPHALEAVNSIRAALDVPTSALSSTLGRILARAHEAAWAADAMTHFYDKLIAALRNGDRATAFTGKWNPDTWPAEASGAGFDEAPRGALGHWISIGNGTVERYQCVVPTTWNAAPRSDERQLGPYEAALMGIRLAVPEQPLEILRTLHSFDPCLSCATHLLGPDGSELLTVHLD